MNAIVIGFKYLFQAVFGILGVIKYRADGEAILQVIKQLTLKALVFDKDDLPIYFL
jgi:hypothetical protein